MNLIISIIIIILTVQLFVFIAKKANIPTIISLIVSGLILNIPFLKKLIIEPHTSFIFNFGDFALLALMFIAGLETSWQTLYKERKDSFLIASFTAVFTFAIGFAIFKLLGFSLITSLIIGICMSITAEATRAQVLLDLKKLKTRVGSAMMGAGIIDDVFGMGLFIAVTYFLKSAFLKEDLLIAAAILSFFIGVYLQRNLKREHPHLKKVEKLLMNFVVPFFFVSVGLHFNFGINSLTILLTLTMISFTITGKMIGTMLVKPFTTLNFEQLYLIGWAMTSKGAVEMALGLIAFRSGLIPSYLFSGIILMAITTTAIFPFIVTRAVKKNPDIME
ncbi:cation:proton antiporter [Candidatus Woesearchaeota archaeon]|nr:cation:proton antiporter [Candidatus Woesearchaeota archaeon]